MKKKKLRVAVVGVGYIGKQHIEAVNRIPGTEVVAIVQTKLEDAKKIAEMYDVENYFTDLDELIEYGDVDVVHICTPNYLHHSMAKKLITANLNVFCEKPLTLNSQESKELVQLADKYNVKAGVNLNYRGNVMAKEMRHRVISGEIGTPLLGQGQYIQDRMMYEDDYSWHLDPALVGPSTAVADVGTHLFDLIQYVYNEKIVSVFADFITVYSTRKKREQLGETFSPIYGKEVTEVKIENEEAAFIIAELESGVKVSLDISLVTGGYKNDLELVVSGSKKSLKWNQERPEHLVVGNRVGGNELIYADPMNVDESIRGFASLPAGATVGYADGLKNSILGFYNDLFLDKDKGQITYVSFEEGHYLMKLVEASLLSSKEKRWVRITA